MLDFSILDRVARTRPLIHCISNIVSANDCANLVLAVGASPIMAQAPEEMATITAASAATASVTTFTRFSSLWFSFIIMIPYCLY